MSTRQSRCLLIDAAIHVHARREDLPGGAPAQEADAATSNEWFAEYLGAQGAFVLEHESRHVHQIMAYPALYLRAIREYHWALAALADFRERGDLEYDPTGQYSIVLDPSAPEVRFLTDNYRTTVVLCPAGCTHDGRVVWGNDPLLDQVDRIRFISETTLLEAEALVIQYRLATRRGFVGGFRSWARARRVNPSAVNDIVTVLCGTRDREPIERAVLNLIPALVWHAFHTSRPATAFFNFLDALLAGSDVEGLRSVDIDMLFGIVGSVRFEPHFLDHCPLFDPGSFNELAHKGMPTTESFVQFDESSATWQALVAVEPGYALSGAIAFRVPDGRWPDPLDFVDPRPDMIERLQIAYPPSAYVLRVAPGRTQDSGGGFYRRWIPRTPWRDRDSDNFGGRLVLLEVAQTLLANVYVVVPRPEAQYGGDVQPTCWHVACPVHPTGLCRFWDSIPGDYRQCEYLQTMPEVMQHLIDSTCFPPKVRRLPLSSSPRED